MQNCINHSTLAESFVFYPVVFRLLRGLILKQAKDFKRIFVRNFLCKIIDGEFE